MAGGVPSTHSHLTFMKFIGKAGVSLSVSGARSELRSGKQLLCCVNSDRKLPGCGCNSPPCPVKTHTSLASKLPHFNKNCKRMSPPISLCVGTLCERLCVDTNPCLSSLSLQQSDMSSTYLLQFTFTWLIFSACLSFHLWVVHVYVQLEESVGILCYWPNQPYRLLYLITAE